MRILSLLLDYLQTVCPVLSVMKDYIMTELLQHVCDIIIADYCDL